MAVPPDASEAELKKRTLTNLYNLRPTWLDNAHRKLDAAVLDAYGWPHDLADEQILERLLALNLERPQAGGGASQPDHAADDTASDGHATAGIGGLAGVQAISRT